jgi:hypothetical protein
MLWLAPVLNIAQSYDVIFLYELFYIYAEYV